LNNLSNKIKKIKTFFKKNNNIDYIENDLKNNLIIDNKNNICLDKSISEQTIDKSTNLVKNLLITKEDCIIQNKIDDININVVPIKNETFSKNIEYSRNDISNKNKLLENISVEQPKISKYAIQIEIEKESIKYCANNPERYFYELCRKSNNKYIGENEVEVWHRLLTKKISRFYL